MSKYTTEVRFICESLSGLDRSEGYSSIENIVQSSIPKIFDFDFPIYDENYRNVLCSKILRHYYTREIGAETYGLWKHWLCTRLNEIMPYYNQMYRSAMLEFNPFYDVELTTTHNRKNNGTSTTSGNGTQTGSASGTDDSLNAYSDTPQGALDNVENLKYLTNARKVDSKSNSSFNSSTNTSDNTTANSTEDYLQTIKGKNGSASYSQRLNEFRNTFINIDLMIIENLSDLFLNLW